MNQALGWYHRWLDRLAARWPDTERRRALAAGLGFGASGGLLALLIVVGYVGWTMPYDLVAADLGPLAIAYGLAIALGIALAAGLGAAIAGAPLWWAIVERPDEPTALRGGLVGAVVGVVAHPLMWLLFGVGAGVVLLVTEGFGALVDAVLGDPGGLLGAFVLFSVVGLIITGIVTVPVAAGTGVVLAHVQRKAAGFSRAADRRRPDDL